MNFNQMVASCISSNSITSTCHAHASYCCIWLCIYCRHRSFSIGPAPETFQSTCLWSSASLVVYQASKPPLFISIKPYSLAPALSYCFRTTTIHLLLCAAVVEPLSSAWPVIATVTRWNPLACVGVAWAMLCSYNAMLATLRVVSGLVHLGGGLEWNDYVGNESGVVNTIW